MGGRVASMIADQLHASGRITELLCLGYTFHPIGKPDQLRTAHLVEMQTPTHIVQGTRDLFGAREEVATYELSGRRSRSSRLRTAHDLKPRNAIWFHRPPIT